MSLTPPTGILYLTAVNFSLQRPAFNLRPAHVRYVVEKVALMVFVQVHWSSPVTVIPPMLHSFVTNTL